MKAFPWLVVPHPRDRPHSGATLVYRRRAHLISLLAVPDGEAAVAAPRNIAGYNVLTWKQNGIVYWHVSDVAAADLEQFASAFRNAAA